MHQKIVFAAIVIACSLPVATAPATFPQTPAEIDVSLGHINGKVALSLWPAKGLEDQRLIDPSGFEAHLAKEEDLDEELIFPCGTWFQPPPGRYKFWLEGRGSISPFSSVLHFAGGPFKTQGLAGVTPVVPGGVVALSHEGRLKGDIALRLLHIDSHNSAPKIRREMSRRLIGDAMSQGALMPEGLVLAALFDKSSNEYLAISRPVQVSRRATTWVRPQPPKANTDLLVVLDRPILLTDRARYDVEPVLVGLTGNEKRPDVTVPTPERLYAIWYDLQGKY
ncbi:MAG: hypothetical protein GY856_46700, partial [bacterium]|nr:hypothetical protein [bacterium]